MNEALGIVRRWIQRNALNGSDVTWGSNDALRFNRSLTVKDLEELALDIAEGSPEEDKDPVYVLTCESSIYWYKDHEPWDEVFVKVLRKSYVEDEIIVLLYLDEGFTVLHPDHTEEVRISGHHVRRLY